MKLNVGQIVYVIPEKQTVVNPMRVDEEITKKMLSNNFEVVTETDYTLRSCGPNPKHSFFSNIQGEVFESSEHAKNAMIDRATRSINKHIEIAVNKAAEWFGREISQQPVQIDEIEETDTAYVDLGNGIKGRVRLNT